MYLAASSLSLPIMELLAANGAHVNQFASDGSTPLHAALASVMDFKFPKESTSQIPKSDRAKVVELLLTKSEDMVRFIFWLGISFHRLAP
jgi:hypothetical protein